MLVPMHAKQRAVLLNKICRILQFLCRFVNTAHNAQFCTHWPILCKILHAQNSDILNFSGVQYSILLST